MDDSGTVVRHLNQIWMLACDDTLWRWDC